jgi:septal ring factor EnvC (AmiA/AmiB activator)
MDEQNWFQKKWGTLGEVPTELLLKKIEELEKRMIKLEEENIETTNTLYEIMHSVDAVDARIDILHTHNNE